MPLTTTMSSDLPPTYFGHYKLSLCWSMVLQCKTQQQPVRPFTSSYVQCNLPQWWCYFIMQVLILQPLLLLLIHFPHATGIATIRILCLTHTILCSQLCHMHFTWCMWHNGCSKCAMCAHAHGANYDCLYQWSKTWLWLYEDTLFSRCYSYHLVKISHLAPFFVGDSSSHLSVTLSPQWSWWGLVMCPVWRVAFNNILAFF